MNSVRPNIQPPNPKPQNNASAGKTFKYSDDILSTEAGIRLLIERGEVMTDLLVVKAKLKDAAKGYNVSGDFAEALDKKLRQLVADACNRAEGNNRKTVMSKDL